MVLEITRREVLNNLIRFKDNLLERRDERNQQQEEQKKKKERTYKVLLNRRTGDMRFAQKISSIEHHISQKTSHKGVPEDWKEIHLIVEQKSGHDPVHFEVLDNQNHPLKPADLDPMAWRIASETVSVLNLKAKEVKEMPSDQLPEEAVLHDLSSIHLAPTKQQIEDLPGWVGSLNRLDAEKKLIGKPVGTYLLREGDEITVSISFRFAEENLFSIHPYLMTVVEKEEKISDILLLQTDKGWTLYHDNPDLKDSDYHYHPSPQGLIHTLSHTAKHPLKL